MSQNTGTLITSAIRPNSSLDPIASAFSSEIKGGLHSVENISERDNIILERRDWGMLSYVSNENKTYQLKYNHISTNIMDNSNWIEFSDSLSSGSNQWIDSVKSIEFEPPSSPSFGDRHLAGLSSNDSLIGSWSSFNPGVILEWNSINWISTEPLDGSSLRVNDNNNWTYKYNGDFPTGEWIKERVTQILSLMANSNDGINYVAESSNDYNEYLTDMILVVKFDSTNSSSDVFIDINSIGSVRIKKPTNSGLVDLVQGDIIPHITYSLIYNGQYFELVKHFTGDNALNIKYYIEPDETVVVPPFHQYWVYGNLTIDGSITNYGQVVIANGDLINSNNFNNFGDLTFVELDDGSLPTPITEVHPGNGLTGGGTFGSVTLGVETGDGIEIVNNAVSVNIGPGLTFSSGGELTIDIDDVKAVPVYEHTTGDILDSISGFTLQYTPSQYSRLQVFVNGLEVDLTSGSPSVTYDNGTNILNWVDTDYSLDSDDRIRVVYEAFVSS